MFAALSVAHAVTLTAPPQVVPAERGATITWKTDVECGSRVNYGTKADFLDQRADGSVSASHTVTLEGLQTGTTYFFAVGSARQRLATGSFTTTSDASGRPLPKLQENTSGKAVAAPLLKPPPTRATWGSIASLQDHFDRHGADFKATSPDDYAAQAWLFLQRAKAEGLPMKLDAEDGTLRVWEPKTRSFAAYNRDGTTKTFFKPSNPQYWDRQPGRKITAAELKFR